MISAKEKKESDISIITFTIENADYLVFKKYQVLLKIRYKMNLKQVFSYLLDRVKIQLEKENKYLDSQENPEFLEKFTAICKKNVRIQNPKKVQINISPADKIKFHNVAYSLVKKNDVQDFSYYYLFKNILHLNEDLI